ncbi:hypothetical protein BX661DRAFT_189356 [Kickxella alabastrina]|uniref:uncharacterized protein n=1 Tax=Kickxella alabastrina TaxID=61397 RepID=UPI0022211BE4|nr:uncharacterized protein BX661DRAFT_189356 [Kickxella alabastrina]KAI7820231.1 hypothetical protein BX661DRAFT_189356 [Kickxella alabastrina]
MTNSPGFIPTPHITLSLSLCCFLPCPLIHLNPENQTKNLLLGIFRHILFVWYLTIVFYSTKNLCRDHFLLSLSFSTPPYKYRQLGSLLTRKGNTRQYFGFNLFPCAENFY